MTGDSNSRYYADLAQVLAGLFEDKREIKVVAKDVGIDWRDVDPDGSVRVHWQNVVSVARNQRKVRSLLELATGRYPDDPDLARLSDEFDPTTEYQELQDASAVHQSSLGLLIDGDCSNAVVMNQVSVSGSVYVNQGVSEETLRELISRIPRAHVDSPPDVIGRNKVQMLTTRFAPSNSQVELNDDLIWDIVDQIKEARLSLSHKLERILVSKLKGLFDATGSSWSKILRVEALLILAEEERMKLSRAKSAGMTLDTRKLKKLLEELRNV